MARSALQQLPFEWVWNDSAGGPPQADATGGGVSVSFAKPSFQNGYNIPNSINSGGVGRGIPDISGNASAISGYNIYTNGVAAQTVWHERDHADVCRYLLARINAYLTETLAI